MAPKFSMISASLNATSAELHAEHAIASRGDDREHVRAIEAKLGHIADLHRQILGRPIAAASVFAKHA